MSHGFYGIMVGFAIDTSRHEDQFLPMSLERVTLTCDGIRFFMRKEPDLLPDISEEYIEDKSKANGLAKFLVCFQASWFCIQVIVRLAQSLPISLLELNTFAHSICTLVIFYFWWNKPLNIGEPTLIWQEEIRPLAAFMSMRSFPNTISGSAIEVRRVEDRSLDKYGDGRGVPVPERPTPKYLDKAKSSDDQITPITKPDSITASSSIPTTSETRPTAQSFARESVDVQEGQTVPGSDIAFRFWSTPERNKYKGKFPLHLSASTVSRWRLATVARHQYRLGTDRVGGEGVEAHSSLCIRVSNFAFFPKSSGREQTSHHWIAKFALVFAPALYGGMHAVAWYMAFPTYAEQVLWRMSVCFIMTATLLWVVEGLYTGEDEEEHRRKYDDILMGDGTVITTRRSDAPREGWDKYCHTIAPCLVCGILFLAGLKGLVAVGYIFSRTFLVVECFINVAHLPPGVYNLPSWVVYIPHIS
jgi:hypothetical protein